MSNKLTKSEGRARPSWRTPSGYRIEYRTLSPETLPRLEAAARLALAASKPPIPTQRLEVAPNEWRDIENPHDTAYQEALETWAAAVQQDAGMRFLTLCEEYALLYEIDAEEVAALRAAYAAAGDTSIAELSDKTVFLWWIALPSPDDQLTLYSKLFGGLTEEAIQAQKASFLGQLSGAAAPSSA